MFSSVGSHLVGQLVEDLVVMSLADARRDHVPQVPQHGHEGKRLTVCTAGNIFISMCE